MSSKTVTGSFHERHHQQHQHQQRDTTVTYPLHPLGSSMGYRPQNSADYLETDLRGVHINNNNYQANNNNYQTNNNNYQANNNSNMHIVNSTGAMAPPIHQSYLPMPSSGDYTMNSSHMNMYNGYNPQMPVSVPSYANAYQQAVSAALSNPYANGGLPASYYGAAAAAAAMNNMGASNNMSLLGGNSIDDPTASSSSIQGLHTGGGGSAPSTIEQTSPSRVSYEEELMAQHSMSSASMSGSSKPPPPSGPAPSTAISPVQQSLGDTSGGFVYGSSINYSSQYAASIVSAVSGPVSNASINSSNSNTDNNNNNNNRPHSYKERKAGKQYQQQLLPEHERCTLKCSGVPHYVTEQDIRTHFEAFGFVVELQIVAPTPSPEDPSTTASAGGGASSGAGAAADGKKKVYNECLVQFYSAANAKKCFTSPLPVLNNRFIHLHVSTFNITPVTDVPTPTPDIIERDARLLNESILLIGSSSSSTSTGGSTAMDRKKLYSTVHTQGVSNKYRRLSDDQSSVIPAAAAAALRADTPNDSNAMSSGDQKDSNPVDDGCVSAAAATVVDPSEAHNVNAVVKSVLSPSGVVALTKEKLELKEKHEQLKALRQQAEDILKRKEGVLQVRKLTLLAELTD